MWTIQATASADADHEQRERSPQRAVPAVPGRHEHECHRRRDREHRRDIAQCEREVELGVEVVGVRERAAERPLARDEVGEHAGATDRRDQDERHRVAQRATPPFPAREAGERHEAADREPDDA